MRWRAYGAVFLGAGMCVWGPVGCASGRPSSATSSNHSEQAESESSDDNQRGESPSTVIDRQSLDEAVIEAVLIDLLTGTNEDAEALRREQGEGRLLFTGSCREWVGALGQTLERAESEEWQAMDAASVNSAKAAAAMMKERVERGSGFKPFRPKDHRITLWEDTTASPQPPRLIRFDDDSPIVAAPPGYADNNRIAVVVLGFAWSMHSGDAVYVLRLEGDSWHVISRAFSYYL